MENEHIKFIGSETIAENLKKILKSEDLSKIEITVTIKFNEDDETAKRKKREEEETLERGKEQDAERRFQMQWEIKKRSLKFRKSPTSIYKEEKRKLREQFDAEKLD